MSWMVVCTDAHSVRQKKEHQRGKLLLKMEALTSKVAPDAVFLGESVPCHGCC